MRISGQPFEFPLLLADVVNFGLSSNFSVGALLEVTLTAGSTESHTSLNIKDSLQIIVTLCGCFGINHRASTIFSVVSETEIAQLCLAADSGEQSKTKKKIPTKPANKTSAHYVEIALACRSLVISFVSNVLIVTDYMLLSSP